MFGSCSKSEEDIESFSCVLCFRVIEKAHERYLVWGKSKFDVKEAIKQLPFTVSDTSAYMYICRQCLSKLKKRTNLISQEKNIVAELTTAYQKGKHKRQENRVEEEPAEKRSNVSSFEVDTTSTNRLLTSKEDSAVFLCQPSHCSAGEFSIAIPTGPPLSQSTPIKEKQAPVNRTSVNVKVSWPSKTLERTLHPELESLGKMMVRGTFKQIANAAWNSKQIRKHLTIKVLKQIDKECSSLCSRLDPSCLRSPSKQKMLDFSFEKENEELQERAPLFYSVLVASGCNRKKTDKNTWIPAVGMAAAVLLRNRSPYMNAVQLMLGIFLYHSNWAVSTFTNTLTNTLYN